MRAYPVVAEVAAVEPVPDAPAFAPGVGVAPSTSLVAPDVVPGVEDGAVFGWLARGSPSSAVPQPATKIDRTKTTNSAVENLFIPSSMIAHGGNLPS
jgi:hypothetical protein